MQAKQISGEGHTAYLVYSSDTVYREDLKQVSRQESNYYSTLKYRQKLTEDFDNAYFNGTFGNKAGKVRGI